jgi:type II secretory pathway pseudopilin PulG
MRWNERTIVAAFCWPKAYLGWQKSEMSDLEQPSKSLDMEFNGNATMESFAPRGHAAGCQPGFSIIEIMVVMMLTLAVMGISVIKLQPFLQQVQANSAMEQVKETLRQGRELAISQRRTIVVQFSGGNTLKMFQVAEPSNTMSTTAFVTLQLPGQAQFMTYSGEIDTPAGFGIPASGGLEFGGSSGLPTSGVQFQSDGTFTDGNGNPINGTVFIGLPNVPTSSRAITILGNTGRIKPYYYTGSAWLQ